MTNDYQQGSRDRRAGWRSAAFGDVLFGQWLPRTSTARTVDEFRRVTLAARENDEVRFVADAANGVVWRFLYLPDGGVYPWKFIGGPPITATVGTSESLGATTGSFLDAATVGPRVFVPFAGDYNITAQVDVAFATAVGIVSFGVASGASSPIGGATYDDYSDGTAGATATTNGFWLLTGRAAGEELRLRYQQGSANNSVGLRALRVTPVKVG